MKMYIAVLDEFPDHMTPTLVAHAVLGYDISMSELSWDESTPGYSMLYQRWKSNSFKKCVVRVNQKEFDKIAALPNAGAFHENHTLNAKKACAVIVVDEIIPNVLKFAKLWKPVV